MEFDTTKLPPRFWAKVNREGPIPAHRPDLGPCWVWTASRGTNGYGHWGVGRRTVYAHRSAYEALVGFIEPGMEIDHLCRVRACCNPSHLEPVTHQTNCVRGEWPGLVSARNRLVTHCVNGHAFDPGNTRTIVRDGYTRRVCRECVRRDGRARYRASRLAETK